MTVQLQAAPVLSTPESHIFEDPTPSFNATNTPRLSNDELWSVYEIRRTAREISDGGWKRVALQFPDHMLGDAVRVFEGLEKELSNLILKKEDRLVSKQVENGNENNLETSFNRLSTSTGQDIQAATAGDLGREGRHRLYVLADTSYGACCVDEIAAEHIDAEVVVHYGRSCLSPTARLPVIYVFTSRKLDVHDVVVAFEATYLQSDKGSDREDGCKGEKVMLIADIIYHSHIPATMKALESHGWNALLGPETVHDPSSLIPNRKVEVDEEELKTYSIFHISDPPPSLLLTLSSRVKRLHIYPTTSTPIKSSPTTTIETNTRMALHRRYALLTSLSTCGIFGILINTLSVRNYLQTVSSIKAQISAADKKSYTFVVGKVNAAKIANFSEIGGWVVIGCWESSLIESTEFYKPIITPFELGLALMGDEQRVWTGGWRGDFESLPPSEAVATVMKEKRKKEALDEHGGTAEAVDEGDLDSEEESEPPEFDLRTGRYVSHSRPMRTRSTLPGSSADHSSSTDRSVETSQALARRAKLDVATVNGTVSPGAEYLRSQRIWTGLGSDFHEEEASQSIEEGRSGIARGYNVGGNGHRT